jgi:hypothetical protein
MIFRFLMPVGVVSMITTRREHAQIAGDAGGPLVPGMRAGTQHARFHLYPVRAGCCSGKGSLSDESPAKFVGQNTLTGDGPVIAGIGLGIDLAAACAHRPIQAVGRRR